MTKGQQSVYDALASYGPLPDHALVPIVQHVGNAHQTSSSIRSRRAELVRAGHVTGAGAIKMPSGRKAHVWAIT